MQKKFLIETYNSLLYQIITILLNYLKFIF